MSKIAVAMSGGVDSSVTAALLKQQGHDVIGITMCLFTPRSMGVGSPVYDASVVAEHLGILHHVADFSQDFNNLIIANFIDQYRSGQTPNPCVRCNRFIKFGVLLERARELGAELLATGHYVRKTTSSDGICHLLTAHAIGKDQSYFLYTLAQEQLRQLIFPIGDFKNKDEVRKMAREYTLPVAEKSDSQEVCFIPNDDYVAFLEGEKEVSDDEGKIIHIDGKVVGCHKGTHRYTVGQRKGLGIAWPKPLYVTTIDPENKVIIVGEEPYLYANGLKAESLSWINQPEGNEFVTTCKIRYRQQPVACHVKLLADNSCEVYFEQPQKSVTPGQSLVFYSGDEVLGGGRIVASFGANQPVYEN